MRWVTAAIFGLVVVWSGIEGAQSWMEELSGSAGPTGTLLLLATFVGMALGPMLAVPSSIAARSRASSVPYPAPVAPFPHDAGDLCGGLRDHSADPDTQR
jgi:hypothetical protein